MDTVIFTTKVDLDKMDLESILNDGYDADDIAGIKSRARELKLDGFEKLRDGLNIIFDDGLIVFGQIQFSDGSPEQTGIVTANFNNLKDCIQMYDDCNDVDIYMNDDFTIKGISAVGNHIYTIRKWKSDYSRDAGMYCIYDGLKSSTEILDMFTESIVGDLKRFS